MMGGNVYISKSKENIIYYTNTHYDSPKKFRVTSVKRCHLISQGCLHTDGWRILRKKPSSKTKLSRSSENEFTNPKKNNVFKHLSKYYMKFQRKKPLNFTSSEWRMLTQYEKASNDATLERVVGKSSRPITLDEKSKREILMATHHLGGEVLDRSRSSIYIIIKSPPGSFTRMKKRHCGTAKLPDSKDKYSRKTKSTGVKKLKVDESFIRIHIVKEPQEEIKKIEEQVELIGEPITHEDLLKINQSNTLITNDVNKNKGDYKLTGESTQIFEKCNSCVDTNMLTLQSELEKRCKYIKVAETIFEGFGENRKLQNTFDKRHILKNKRNIGQLNVNTEKSQPKSNHVHTMNYKNPIGPIRNICSSYEENKLINTGDVRENMGNDKTKCNFLDVDPEKGKNYEEVSKSPANTCTKSVNDCVRKPCTGKYTDISPKKSFSERLRSKYVDNRPEKRLGRKVTSHNINEGSGRVGIEPQIKQGQQVGGGDTFFKPTGGATNKERRQYCVPSRSISFVYGFSSCKEYLTDSKNHKNSINEDNLKVLSVTKRCQKKSEKEMHTSRERNQTNPFNLKDISKNQISEKETIEKYFICLPFQKNKNSVEYIYESCGGTSESLEIRHYIKYKALSNPDIPSETKLVKNYLIDVAWLKKVKSWESIDLRKKAFEKFYSVADDKIGMEPNEQKLPYPNKDHFSIRMRGKNIPVTKSVQMESDFRATTFPLDPVHSLKTIRVYSDKKILCDHSNGALFKNQYGNDNYQRPFVFDHMARGDVLHDMRYTTAGNRECVNPEMDKMGRCDNYEGFYTDSIDKELMKKKFEESFLCFTKQKSPTRKTSGPVLKILRSQKCKMSVFSNVKSKR